MQEAKTENLFQKLRKDIAGLYAEKAINHDLRRSL